MIENQSDNVEKKEENVSDESNVSESSSVIEDKISEDKELPEIDDEKIKQSIKTCSFKNLSDLEKKNWL